MLNAGIIRKTELKRNYMMATDNQNRKAIVVMENTIKKTKLQSYLQINNYQPHNICFIQKGNNYPTILIAMIHSFRPDDLIVLRADELSSDPAAVQDILDISFRMKIRVISILDRITVKAQGAYLRKMEHMTFTSVVRQRTGNFWRADIYDKLGIENKEIKKKKRIGIYCRVSTREQTLGYSIDNQKNKCQDYMHLFNDDYTEAVLYIDEGHSASTLERPSIKQMLQDVRDRKLDEIIIYKLDRLTRNVIDTYELLNMFANNDVNLVAVMDNLDITTANGKLVVGILAIFAQWERETIVERTNDGLLQMAMEGKYPKSGVLLGYSKDKEKYLTINEETASIIKSIFMYAKAGYPLSDIRIKIKEIYDYKLRTDRIKRIIFENGYYGEFTYKDYVFPDVMQAIVSKEDAMEAKKVVGKRSVAYGKEQNKFYYRNKITCKNCGNILGGIPTYKRNKKYYYYYCKKCNQRINQDVICHQAIHDMITHIDKADYTREAEDILRDINRLQRKLKTVSRQYAEDFLSDEAYDTIVKSINLKLNKEKARFGKIKIVNGYNWNELSDSEKRGFIEQTILTMYVDLSKKEIIKIEYHENDNEKK